MTDQPRFSWTRINAPDINARREDVRAGVDRVELEEFQRTVEVAGDRFLLRVFTPAELSYCGGRIERLATRFAAKEAMAKALGTGFRGVGPRDIEVLAATNGEPTIDLHGEASRRANELGMTALAVSLTHTAACAEAFVVAITCAPDNPRRQRR